ncbi:MAG: hypothetical protein ACOCQD_02050 [archaeon]
MMKIRNGFVSNSSSSSFVIGGAGNQLLEKAKKALGEQTLTVKDVALVFLEEIIEEEKEELSRDEEDLQKRFSQRRVLKKTNDDVRYVHFDSFNENTDVFYYEDNIVVMTTRNLDLSGAVEKIEKTHQIWGEEEGYPFDFDPEYEFDDKYKLKL